MRLRSILILLIILIVLGGGWYFSNMPELPPEKEPQLYVWLVEMEDLQHIEIRLPREDMSESFIKDEQEGKFPWYFDDPQRSPIDSERWGGGIPLLLSGPGVHRVIAKDATEEQIAKFGLAEPQMEITLGLKDGRVLDIKVGDRTPDGNAFYVQAPSSNEVALVDYTWYEVIARIVKEPPYVPASAD